MWVTCTLRKSLDRLVLESFAKAEKLTSVKPRGILRWKNSNRQNLSPHQRMTSKLDYTFWYFLAKLFRNGHFWTILYLTENFRKWKPVFYYKKSTKMNFWTSVLGQCFTMFANNLNIFIEFLLYIHFIL